MSYPMTKEEYEMLKKELEYLKKVKRKEIVEAIATARAHGDLSENAEYDAAKEEQGLTEAKIANLEGKLSQSEIIDPSKIQSDKVMFGAKVKIYDDEQEKEIWYEILGEFSYDLSKGQIPYNSPIAKALIGSKVGDWVEVEMAGGTKDFEILEIKYN